MFFIQQNCQRICNGNKLYMHLDDRNSKIRIKSRAKVTAFKLHATSHHNDNANLSEVFEVHASKDFQERCTL